MKKPLELTRPPPKSFQLGILVLSDGLEIFVFLQINFISSPYNEEGWIDSELEKWNQHWWGWLPWISIGLYYFGFDYFLWHQVDTHYFKHSVHILMACFLLWEFLTQLPYANFIYPIGLTRYVCPSALEEILKKDTCNLEWSTKIIGLFHLV